MKAKHKDLEISQDNPFANCKLGREADARALNDLIESIEGGGTIAINGAWGFGKTTFLRMWKQDLEQEGYRVILFNAWETDFSTEPLVSILGEIGSLINDPSDTQLETISKGLAKYTKKVTPRALSMLVKKLTGIDCAEIVKELGEHAISSFEEEVLSYKARKDEFGKIKNQLETLVESQSPRKPVIFIVDELDRCRPDYAVEVLEKIKHLFSVNNLIFVLAVDKEQLCHAIKGYYGSSELNASEYLRRFIDIEYNLDSPNYESIVQYFFEYFYLNNLAPNMEESNRNDYIDEISKSIELIALISADQRLSMRQVEKWIVHLSPIGASGSHYVRYQLETIALLTFFKLFSPKIYQGIKDLSYRLPKLIQDTKDLFHNRLAKELQKEMVFDPILSFALCELYLSYHHTLCMHVIFYGPYEGPMEEEQEGMLECFFQDCCWNEPIYYKLNSIKSFNLRPVETDDLINIIDKQGRGEVKCRWE